MLAHTCAIANVNKLHGISTTGSGNALMHISCTVNNISGSQTSRVKTEIEIATVAVSNRSRKIFKT